LIPHCSVHFLSIAMVEAIVVALITEPLQRVSEFYLPKCQFCATN
jgi:hypothetical protein